MSSRKITDVPATQNFDFIHGSFQLSNWTIPYFTTSITFQEAADDLRLATDLPGGEDIEWKLSELYQRDIDWLRVERQILPYLRSSDKPQFFNSITIALLPYDPTKSTVLNTFEDGEGSWRPPELTDPAIYATTSTLGPISFGFWDTWETPEDQGFRTGRLRWNKNQVFGVAIDGQHRLAAIKKLAQNGTNSGVLNSRVPAIFLLFDEFAGFNNPKDTATVEVLRALFTDLNKHAQTVKRGRQILLDDRDPHAYCTRDLIAEKLEAGTATLAQSIPSLPLSLVDWHSEQAKFDDGPYLTTVLGIDWMVMKTLGSKPISDWMDYSAIGKQISLFRNRLGIPLSNAEQRLTDLEQISMRPFSYDENDLKEISEAFKEKWCKPLVTILTKFEPYSSLIALRTQNNSYGLDFQHWFRLHQAKEREGSTAGESTREYDRFMHSVKTDPFNPRGENDYFTKLGHIRSAKKDSLAFNVVFQRAFVDGYLGLAKLRDEHIDALVSFSSDDEDIEDFGDAVFDDVADTPTEKETVGRTLEASGETPEIDCVTTEEARANEYVEALNRVVKSIPDFLDIEYEHETSDGTLTPFWLGSFLKAEGGIDFTQGASTRAKDLLFLIVAMIVFDEKTDPVDESEFDAFWDSCVDSQASRFHSEVTRTVRRLTKNESGSLAARVMRARGETYDTETAEKEVYDRLYSVWAALGL